MINKNFDIICFGEILWDIFPEHQVIGGAPLNLALRAHSFGLNVSIISRLGRDEMASKVKEYLLKKEIDSDFIQEDNDWPTGFVTITLDPKGSASYEINKPAAWDYIKLTIENIEAVENAKVFLFGSLAARNEVSKKTLLRLISKSAFKVFDVNLRKPDYSMELIEELMSHADFIKLNDEELDEVCSHLEIKSPEFNVKIFSLAKKTNTKSICVTLGDDGAALLYNEYIYKHPGYFIEVADTVGAGDSFLATLITELCIQQKNPDEALKNACAIGAIVASKKGANPDIGISDIMGVQEK